MDLLDFAGEALYFDDESEPAVAELLARAAECYGTPEAERALIAAYAAAPEDLNVLVGLYRFYYYQHRLPDALRVAEQAMCVAAERLGMTPEWQRLDEEDWSRGAERSMATVRFYLYALKGSGFLEMRLGNLDSALARLNAIARVDREDRIGVRPLIDVANRAMEENRCPNPTSTSTSRN